MYYNPQMETMSRSELEALQSERLVKLVRYVYERVPFYRNKMDAMRLAPSDIKSIRDIVKLPFTEKSDLKDNYPFGLLAVDREELNRIHASSGTTGKPTVVAYTKNDLKNWTECVSRIACMGGATSRSVSGTECSRVLLGCITGLKT